MTGDMKSGAFECRGFPGDRVGACRSERVSLSPRRRRRRRHAEAAERFVRAGGSVARAAAFGYAGDPNVKTPNLDGFEKSCVDFQYAISSMPVCTPCPGVAADGAAGDDARAFPQ